MKAEYLKSFTIAYYKGRWVFVPLFYIPKEAYSEATGELHRLHFIPVEGQEQLPELKRRDSNQIKEEIASTIRETILPWQLSVEEVKKLCLLNGIIFRWVIEHPSFDGQESKNIKESKSNENLSFKRFRKRKIFILNGAEFRRVLKELKVIHTPSAIIAQIMWFLNNSLNEVKGYLTLQEIVRLTIDDISPKDEIQNWIRFHRSSSMIVHYLPPYIWNVLCQQIHSRSWYVFSNQKGGPLLTTQIDRYFSQAGKKAGLKELVTSSSLRPVIKAQRASRKRIGRKVNLLRQITDKEWTQVAPKIIAAHSLTGRRSLYGPKLILNAILYHLTTDCPIKKLPEIYPKWTVVYSQYRRWKKKGITQMIGKELDIPQLMK